MTLARGVEIKACTTNSEFSECVGLQRAVWQFADLDIVTPDLLVVTAKTGGQVLGAFDHGRMIGFLYSVPALRDKLVYLHSHMLAVLPEYQNQGIGRRLKLAQRDEALSREIKLIEWTFDPLELKNAFLNIEKLGAIVRRYNPNQYGTTSSPLHGGLPTDRCIAEWWIASPRAAGQRAAHPETAERISYPADIARIRAEEPARAREIQQANAEKFLDAFARGLAVTGFARTETEGTYLLEPWQ